MKSGINFKNVSFSYQNGHLEIKNVNLQISEGAFCGIVGLNGSGKTTLTLLLNGLIPHEIRGKLTGDVFVDGFNTRTKPVSYFARSVGMLFQNPDFMLFNLTVAEEIDFGLKNLKLGDRLKRISQALATVGMAGYEERDPQTLSMGQKQKLCLACVLAMDTKYIVLDEPTAMLDYKSAVNLYRLLHTLNQSGKTIVIVEHDSDFLLTVATQIVALDKGRIALSGDPRQVFSQTEKLKKIGIKIPRLIR